MLWKLFTFTSVFECMENRGPWESTTMVHLPYPSIFIENSGWGIHGSLLLHSILTRILWGNFGCQKVTGLRSSADFHVQVGIWTCIPSKSFIPHLRISFQVSLAQYPLPVYSSPQHPAVTQIHSTFLLSSSSTSTVLNPALLLSHLWIPDSLSLSFFSSQLFLICFVSWSMAHTCGKDSIQINSVWNYTSVIQLLSL